MGATFWLLGCVLAPAQTPTRSLPPPVPVVSRPSPSAASGRRFNDWTLTPKLNRGQELVYRGTFTEEASGSRVQFQRAYRVEMRFFVVDVPARGTDLSAFTVLQHRQQETPSRSSKSGAGQTDSGATSLRLEKIHLDPQGKVTRPGGGSLTVPLDGAPTLEVGCFVELPRGRLVVNQGWEVNEPGRPVRAWRVAGHDNACGQACVKLVGLQQSDDWEQPRADRGAWRRKDTVWISPRTGLTLRVERVIEQREPARREISQKSRLRYDVESGLQYPPQLAQDRRNEILQALQFRETARPMLSAPRKFTKQLESLQRRLNYHIENQPPTPYREAVLLVKRQVEAASRGEVVSLPQEEKPPAKPGVAALGGPAPDFVASSITEPGSTARLSRWKGKPVLFVFYHPSSTTAFDLLRFAESVATVYGKHVSVVGLSVSDETKPVLDQKSELKLTFPILHGGGLRISYAVETTPQLIVIDSGGTVRGVYHGWGRETPAEVIGELKRWIGAR